MKYGFIGCGNMGGAIARALSRSTKDISLTDRSGKGAALAEELGIAYTDTGTIARECDRIFLAVKPHMMAGVLEPLAHLLAARKPLRITMAAGLTMARIQELAGASLPVIRIMPNTPTAVGKGVIPYCANDLVPEGILSDWVRDMVPCGLLDPLEENLLDAASALSGSGPAYAYVLLEALADGAVACGLPRAKALDYAAATPGRGGGNVLKHPLPSRRPEGRGLLPRGQHHRWAAGAGTAGLPGRCHGLRSGGLPKEQRIGEIVIWNTEP